VTICLKIQLTFIASELVGVKGLSNSSLTLADESIFTLFDDIRVGSGSKKAYLLYPVSVEIRVRIGFKVMLASVITYSS
jgi:hypothetical protein